MNYNILIGGAAGQGVDTTSKLIQTILKRKGFYVFSNKDYMSRVRGGHNFTQIRFGKDKVFSHNNNLDIVIAFNEETIKIHNERLSENGLIICDDDIKQNGNNILKFPFKSTAKDIGNKKVFSSVSIGSLIKLLGLTKNQIKNTIEDFFGDKKLSYENIDAFEKGYTLTEARYGDTNEKIKNSNNHIIINGNEAIALGALAGGVKFYSAYPMAPSTGIMNYLYNKSSDLEILVEQAEDEIAAINMAIGASYAGVRAMTGSSGGGFSLMVEGLGLAAITETPLVVVDVQRPGPATGLPTRTSQGDLSFIINASQDEFPLMVISLRNHEDAFYQTIRALNIADKYQTLVILLSDQYLADSSSTINEYDFNSISIDRNIYKSNNLNTTHGYKRYEYTKTGVSPRLIPGMSDKVSILADSHEHNEYGNIDESIETRNKMMKKRMNKFEHLKNELNEPTYYGSEYPDILLIGWGSSEGALKEATSFLNNNGNSTGCLVFGDVWPLPTEKLKKYSKIANMIINVEHNYSGQLARLITQETTITFDKKILKYDGRQFSGYELFKSIKEVL